MTLIEILNHYDIPFKRAGEHHHAREKWLQINCPWCSSESDKWRMGIHESYYYCSCWNCGRHQLLATLYEITKRDRKELRDHLEGLERVSEEMEGKRGRLLLPPDRDILLPVHRKYLKKRGFNPDYLEKTWGLMGIGLSSKLSWRIFIPIHRRGRVVSWTTRGLREEGLRYINARPEEEEVRAKDLLFGEDLAGNSVVVCEGPFDAMRIGPGGVALMGLVFTPAQVRKIAKYPVRVICFDAEEAAQKRAEALCEALSVFDGETVRVELDAPDPGSASEKEIKELRRRFLR